MQELQRVAVLMPMTIHHIVLEDVQMGKYKVPKGTIVIPQFQSVHQDPNIYSGICQFLNNLFVGIGSRCKTLAWWVSPGQWTWVWWEIDNGRERPWIFYSLAIVISDRLK
jgi:hypothetical protein